MKLTITHEEEMRFSASNGTHHVTVDLPPHAGGTDRGMTPPDLFVSAIGSCIGVYVVEYCEMVGLPHAGMRIHIEWKTSERPNRIGKIDVQVELPNITLDAEHDAGLRNATERCLLHNTLMQAPRLSLSMSGAPLPQKKGSHLISTI